MTTTNNSSLTPLETKLLDSAKTYFGDPEVAAAQEAARQARKRLQQQQSPEAVYHGLLKPLFKEWLELRFDLAVARGPYRKVLSAALMSPLQGRSHRLKAYLFELQPATYGLSGDHRLVLFQLWLCGQVDALMVALGKAASVEGGGGGGGGNGGGGGSQPPSPPSSPFTPQYSPLTPPSSFSSSPVVGSLNNDAFLNAYP